MKRKISILLILVLLFSAIITTNVFAETTHTLTLIVSGRGSGDTITPQGETAISTNGTFNYTVAEGTAKFFNIICGPGRSIEYIKYNGNIVLFGVTGTQNYATPKITANATVEIKMASTPAANPYIITYPLFFKDSEYIYTFGKSSTNLDEYGMKIGEEYYKVNGEDQVAKAKASGIFGIGIKGLNENYTAIPYVKSGETEITGSGVDVNISQDNTVVKKTVAMPATICKSIDYSKSIVQTITSWVDGDGTPLSANLSNNLTVGYGEFRKTYFKFTLPDGTQIPENVSSAKLNIFLHVKDIKKDNVKASPNTINIRLYMPTVNNWDQQEISSSNPLNIGAPIEVGDGPVILEGAGKFAKYSFELEADEILSQIGEGNTVSLFFDIDDAAHYDNAAITFGPLNSVKTPPEIVFEYTE